MRNGHNREANRAWSNVDWFVRDGKLWRRHRERVEEVCWDAGEIRLTLQKEGFDQVRAWDAALYFDDSSFIKPGCRTVYLARKARS